MLDAARDQVEGRACTRAAAPQAHTCMLVSVVAAK